MRSLIRVSVALLLSALCAPSLASQYLPDNWTKPVGTYTITLTRGSWSETSDPLPANPFDPTLPEDQRVSFSFSNHYMVGDNLLNVRVYLQDVWNQGVDGAIEAFTWYLNIDPNTPGYDPATMPLLGGNPGEKLTITVNSLDFDQSVVFERQTNHIYYYDINNSPQWIPGYDRNFSPATLGPYGYYQRTGVRPFDPNSEGIPYDPLLVPWQPYTAQELAEAPAYGQAQALPGDGINFELPDMYVPSGIDPTTGCPFFPTRELSFGVGGERYVPEPMTLAILTIGSIGFIRRKR